MPPKEEKKEGVGLPSHGDTIVTFVALLVVLSLIGALFSKFEALLSGQGSLESPFLIAFWDFYEGIKGVGVLIAAVLICFIIPLVQKITAIRTEERKLLYPQKGEVKGSATNVRWQKVVDHLESDRSNDWKLAILEADIMLGDMLEASGYQGESIGEKLKRIERSDFNTIDKAWEAHKIRNMIAHEGTEYMLTQHEAIRVIELYKDVFEEFYFI